MNIGYRQKSKILLKNPKLKMSTIKIDEIYCNENSENYKMYLITMKMDKKISC